MSEIAFSVFQRLDSSSKVFSVNQVNTSTLFTTTARASTGFQGDLWTESGSHKILDVGTTADGAVLTGNVTISTGASSFNDLTAIQLF